MSQYGIQRWVAKAFIRKDIWFDRFDVTADTFYGMNNHETASSSANESY